MKNSNILKFKENVKMLYRELFNSFLANPLLGIPVREPRSGYDLLKPIFLMA
jgi:hypothetical protein